MSEGLIIVIYSLVITGVATIFYQLTKYVIKGFTETQKEQTIKLDKLLTYNTAQGEKNAVFENEFRKVWIEVDNIILKLEDAINKLAVQQERNNFIDMTIEDLWKEIDATKELITSLKSEHDQNVNLHTLRRENHG